MTTQPTYKLEVFQTEYAFKIAAAELVIAIAEKSIAARGRFTLSLSGGQTPGNLFKLLAEPKFRERMPWKNTFIFWGDERFVPSDDKQNNANMARALLLDHIEIPPININPVPVDLAPGEAAEKYETLLKTFFGKDIPQFDLIFLGLGENGHTASLFPGKDVVFEMTRLVRELYIEDQHMFRITMTPLLINKAYNIIFLVEGENKANILKTVLGGPYQPDKFPAQIINPENGNLYWLVDKKAASLLPAYIKNM